MYIIPSSRQIAWEIAPDAKLKAGTDFWTQPPPSKPLNVPDTCVLTKLYQNGQFLGRFYMEKSGVEGLHMEARDNDDAKAVEFFERAAAQGDANAETNLGWMLIRKASGLHTARFPVGNNQNLWPVASLTLGSVSYTDLQLLSIFNTPAQGNGLLTLAHQLIAAKLNIANGADSTAIAQAISDADALIGSLVVPPVGGGLLAPGATSTLVQALTAYNEGLTGPGHCQ